MNRYIILIVFNLLFVFCSLGQPNSEKRRQKVLKQGIEDSVFVFGKWTSSGEEETRLMYLGQVTTHKGRTLKVMNSIWYWGQSKRATSRILIFDDSNRYVGNYVMTTVDELPTKLENGVLIFVNTGMDCDRKLTTRVNLKKGLPKYFFRKCKGTYGSIFEFDPD